jgi:hypothetical protein
MCTQDKEPSMESSPAFRFIGLEIHSSRMWQLAQVEQSLQFMHQHGFNALVFHESDLVNRLALPETYLNDTILWERFHALRSFAIENNQHYLRTVARRARALGIDLYVNVKEIFVPDEILELYPHLVNPENAVVCPSDPFWAGFISDVFAEICRRVPELKGFIISIGSHESKTAISRRNPCGCPRCKALKAVDWYRDIIAAVHGPLQAAGKTLIVRDFSFTKANQSLLLQGAQEAGCHVTVSLKNTPHDYYPTFPDNPRIGTTGHDEIVEFDTWGQFFGSGFFPVSIAEDMQRRIGHCLAKGVTGLLFRTDWEGMFENSTFNSPNMINLYAAGLLADDPQAKLDDAYRAWGTAGWIDALQSGSFMPTPTPPASAEGWKSMRDFMKASWEVLRKTIYVRDHWFCEDNMFPDSLDKAWKMLVTVHGRDDWEPGASRRLDPCLNENLEIIKGEKQEALQQVQQLRSVLQPEACGFPEATIAQIDLMLLLYEWYVRIGAASCSVVFDTLRANATNSAADKQQALQSIHALLQTRDGVIAVLAAREYPHIAYWLLNEKRMERLADDALRILQET